MQCGEGRDLAKRSISPWHSSRGLPSRCPCPGAFAPSAMPRLLSSELSRCGVVGSLDIWQPEPHQLLVGLVIFENSISFQNEP